VALTIAVAVAILATLGFAVSVASSLTDRRASNALLAALGVSRRTRARQLCLEQVLLAAPAAAVGLLAGAAIAQLLVPAVTLTAAATRPTPPALVYLPMGRALALAAVVALIPVLAAAVTVLSRPDPAAELRATGTA
jgi:ABC-type antimicrobial peptide transport system permease subunit